MEASRLVGLGAIALALSTPGCDRGAEPLSEASVTQLPLGWTELPEPPEVRDQGATAWTGEGLIVWGGEVFTGHGGDVAENDGYVFALSDREWHGMASSPLGARLLPAAAWTGDELLLWGGTEPRLERFFGDGAAYDPERDDWRVLPDAPISARAPLSVWTGSELVVWGTSVRVDRRPRDGAAYDPRTNRWRRIADAPIELTDATAVWTGIEMIVFGAALHGGNFPESPTAIGAAYDPPTDTWRELPDSALSPQASTAAWNGRELIAWDYLNNSAAYKPHAGTWRSLPDVPLDAGECSPSAVAIGSYVLGDHCGLLTLYDIEDDAWRDVSRENVSWSEVELVAADGAALLLNRNPDTGEEQFLAYRPG
jgi:hypothetical protein